VSNAVEGTIEANAQNRYEVTAADLPLHCPMDGMSLWMWGRVRAEEIDCSNQQQRCCYFMEY